MTLVPPTPTIMFHGLLATALTRLERAGQALQTQIHSKAYQKTATMRACDSIHVTYEPRYYPQTPCHQ